MTHQNTPLPSLDPRDPANYDWVPVARRPRGDGWSPELQTLFITTLADTGSIGQAATAAGKTRQSAYAFRRTGAGAGFARAWDAAIAEAANVLLDIAFDRCVSGETRVIQDPYGNQIDVRTTYSNSLLMALIRAHHPRLGRAAAAEAGVLPMDAALALLMPEEPDHDRPEARARLQDVIDDPVAFGHAQAEMRAHRITAEAAWGDRGAGGGEGGGDDPTPGTVGAPVVRKARLTSRVFVPMEATPSTTDDDGAGDPYDWDTDADPDEDAEGAAPRAPAPRPPAPRPLAPHMPQRVPGKREMTQRRKAMARAAQRGQGDSGVKIVSR